MTINVMKTLLYTLILLFLAVLLEWAIINVVLGCVTWNEAEWTKQNSCFPLSQLFGI